MTSEVDAVVREKIRAFMVENGRPIKWDDRFGEREPSVYGWVDYDVEDHIFHWESEGKKTGKYDKYVKVFDCGWVVPEGAVLTEETYSQFVDTYSDNKEEVGINVSGCHCKCSEHRDVTLRYVGTFGEVMQFILGKPAKLKLEL